MPLPTPCSPPPSRTRALAKGLLLFLLLQPLAASDAKMTDAQLEALAQQALLETDPKAQTQALKQLQVHHFKSSLAKEREVALYVEGTLEDRLGQPSKAAATFHRLEQSWPKSGYLPEAQVVMAQAALDHKRYKEAEIRLRKALGADLPAESVRRCQELYLWCLADQGRAAEGVSTIDALKPLGDARPSEKGLVGMLETLCAARRRTEALKVLNDFHHFYPDSPKTQRVDLAWAKLLGIQGEAVGSAHAFQKVIQEGANAPEADEARLALATLLTDGRLTPKEAQGFPAAANLLAELDKASPKEAPARQALLVKVAIALKDRQWQAAIDTVGQLRAMHPLEAEGLHASSLRGEALRSWTQELLDKHQAAPILPLLDGEGIRCLTPAQRLGLVQVFAQMGLPEAATPLMNVAPAAERPALRRAVLEAAGASNPRGTLALLPAKGETPRESLLRAKANAALEAWPETRSALARAKPGPERIQVLLALLNRPAEPREGSTARSKEVEGWLGRAPEKGAEREPLAILAGDLRARNRDWRGALGFYPASPGAENRGWVALMRATCQAHLGQKALALGTLKEAAGDPAYKPQREALSQKLGVQE